MFFASLVLSTLVRFALLFCLHTSSNIGLLQAMERIGQDITFCDTVTSTFLVQHTNGIPKQSSASTILYTSTCGLGWRFGLKCDISPDADDGKPSVKIYYNTLFADTVLKSLSCKVSVTLYEQPPDGQAILNEEGTALTPLGIGSSLLNRDHAAMSSKKPHVDDDFWAGPVNSSKPFGTTFMSKPAAERSAAESARLNRLDSSTTKKSKTSSLGWVTCVSRKSFDFATSTARVLLTRAYNAEELPTLPPLDPFYKEWSFDAAPTNTTCFATVPCSDLAKRPLLRFTVSAKAKPSSSLPVALELPLGSRTVLATTLSTGRAVDVKFWAFSRRTRKISEDAQQSVVWHLKPTYSNSLILRRGSEHLNTGAPIATFQPSYELTNR